MVLGHVCIEGLDPCEVIDEQGCQTYSANENCDTAQVLGALNDVLCDCRAPAIVSGFLYNTYQFKKAMAPACPHTRYAEVKMHAGTAKHEMPVTWPPVCLPPWPPPSPLPPPPLPPSMLPLPVLPPLWLGLGTGPLRTAWSTCGCRLCCSGCRLCRRKCRRAKLRLRCCADCATGAHWPRVSDMPAASAHTLGTWLQGQIWRQCS